MNNFQLRTLRCPNISTQPGVCKNNNEEKSIIEYNVSSGFTALRRGGGGEGACMRWYLHLLLLQRIFPGFWKNVSVYNPIVLSGMTPAVSVTLHMPFTRLDFSLSNPCVSHQQTEHTPHSIICCLPRESFRAERSKRVLSVKVQ